MAKNKYHDKKEVPEVQQNIDSVEIVEEKVEVKETHKVEAPKPEVKADIKPQAPVQPKEVTKPVNELDKLVEDLIKFTDERIRLCASLSKHDKIAVMKALTDKLVTDNKEMIYRNVVMNTAKSFAPITTAVEMMKK